jgi:hypothetical protein
MVIVSMKPGITSWFNVTSALARSVETTLPRSLYTLGPALPLADISPFVLERHPASKKTANTKEQKIGRSTDQCTTGCRLSVMNGTPPARRRITLEWGSSLLLKSTRGYAATASW